MATSAAELADLIGELVYDAGQEHRFPEIEAEVRSYEEAGVLTRDAGLVIRLGDREFQITVIQSR